MNVLLLVMFLLGKMLGFVYVYSCILFTVAHKFRLG